MESDACTERRELKVKELLKEVQLDYTDYTQKLVDDTVSAIKNAIYQIPEDIQVTADVAPGFVRDIGANSVEFMFKRPKSIGICGSYSICCIAKPIVSVDLFIQLPKDCFENKDYLNHRYHAKRFLYLCIVKKHLNLHSFVNKVEWSTFQNEARKPVLVVYSDAKLTVNKRLSIRIIPTAKGIFKIPKLKLARCNLESLPEATPKYNSCILEDMFLEDNAKFVSKTFLGWKELGEALILLKVWARQRESILSHDCLNGFLISVVLAFLTTESGKNCINRSMKPIQIFRVTLSFIATSIVWESGLYFHMDGRKNISEDERKEYKHLFPVVICDPYAHFNFAFRMTRSGFLELRNEAALSISCFDKCEDGFEELFMIKVDYPVKYDHCVRLNLKGNAKVFESGFCLDEECWRLYEQKVYLLLHQGLRDRSKIIRVTWKNIPQDCNIENGFSMFDSEPLLVGISLSSVDNAHRIVDVGPNAENKETIKFRQFWGEKAELRRFKDGTISESTVWECKQWERHLIIKKIVEYILCRHLSLSPENVLVVAEQLDFSLCHGFGDPISFSRNLLRAFEVLSARLRQIQDLPLNVSSVQPLDSAFRFTSVFPPVPHALAYEKSIVPKLPKLIPTCIEPVDVLIQLEGSGSWPMDEEALEKTKSAFLLKIGESLQNKFGMPCSASVDGVDVFMSGYAFRLNILHERGLSLLKQQSGSSRGKWVSSTDKKLFFRSQHSSMINGLQGRYQIYGPTVRLAKRWIASHLFSACLVEEAVELLVARVFSTPLPLSAPCSRISGFLRFLRILSEHDWALSSLVININNDLSSGDMNEINENFMTSRKDKGDRKYGNRTMFLGTAYDKSSEAWTWSSPNPSELRRLVAYGRSSANLLSKLILGEQTDDWYRWECLFRTPLNNYDAVILVHRERLAFPQHLLFPSQFNEGREVAHGDASNDFHAFMCIEELKKGRREDLECKVMARFDPMRCLVRDLETGFGGAFKLWYDSLGGGDAIGLTWLTSSSSSSSSKKRGREEGEDAMRVLRSVGDAGSGFVRSVRFLKPPSQD